MRDFTVTGELQRRRLRGSADNRYFKRSCEYLAKVRGPALGMKFNLRPVRGETCAVVFTEYEFRWTRGGSDTKYHEQRERLVAGDSVLTEWKVTACMMRRPTSRKYLVFEQRCQQIHFRGQDRHQDRGGPYIKVLISKAMPLWGTGSQGRAGNSLVQYQHEGRTECVGRLDPATEKVEIFTTQKV